MPPKATTNTTEPTARPKRTGNTTGTPSTATRDESESVTATKSDIHSEQDAMKWMVEGVYLIEGESVTVKKLAHVLLQVAAASKLTKQGINAMRAAAFILETISIDQEGREIGEAVARSVAEQTKKLYEEQVLPTIREMKKTNAEVAKAAEVMRTAAEAANRVTELNNATNPNTGDTNQVETTIGNLVARTEQVLEMLQEDKQQRANNKTYAAAVSGIPTQSYEQAALVAKGNLHDRQVIVRKAPDAEVNQLASLTERELVEKATVTLELMGLTASDRPPGMKFLAASRTQSGAVIYTLDAAASADYLRKDDVMRAFMAHFGGTSALHVRAHQVVVEHVPVAFKAQDPAALRTVEEASHLPMGSIYEARWIKPIHLRAANQKVAFLIIGFANREAANRVLDYGIMIEGKHCRTRKLLPEPKRCVKCQGYGHFAKECKSEKDTCARCAGQHRTSDPTCQAAQGRPLRCANCLKDGHGAADRVCTMYKNKLAQMRARDPDSKFRLFPTADPHTWARAEEPAPMDRFDDRWRRDAPRQADGRQAHPALRQLQSQRGRPGSGPHYGGRGGRGRGGMRIPQTGGETTAGANRADSRMSQRSNGMRQATLAETWAVNGGRMGAFSTQDQNPASHRRRDFANTDDFDRYDTEGILDADLDRLQTQPDYTLDHHQIYNDIDHHTTNNPPQWSDDDRW